MEEFETQRREAIERLRRLGIISSQRVMKAMLKVPREEFLPKDVRPHAYLDSPLPIGYGQTTSALHMTAMLCEYAELQLGEKVLEVGAGCGYMACVYAEIVAPGDEPKDLWGHVWSVEIVKELAEMANANVKRLGYSNRVTVIHGDGSEGLKEFMPYDAIIVTSTAPEVPKALIDQLSPEGVLLIPVGAPYFYQELIRVRKLLDGRVVKESLGGVAFVPLRGKYGWREEGFVYTA